MGSHQRMTSGVCIRCMIEKPRDAFPTRSDGRRRRVCQACRDEEAVDRERRRGVRRSAGRRLEKLCRGCDRWLPMTGRYFYPENRPGRSGFMAPCKDCKRARVAAYKAAVLADPRRASEFRARAQASRERWEAAHPAEAQKMRTDWERKMRSNRAYRLQRNESQRMAYRLRAEREGREVAPVKEVPGRALRSLPAAPLAAFIEAQAAKHGELNGHAHEMVCEQLGVTDRDFRAWRSGERPTVTFQLVDRVLQRTDALWFDVFDESDPVAHAMAAAVFEG